MLPYVIGIGIFIIVAIVLGSWLITAYNGLVRSRVDSEEAWAQIDTQLKRRHDLVPNLVATVKGYSTHEKETLERVIAARSAAVAADGPAEAGAAEGMLGAALGRLFALAEAYPELKANENFLQLQEELTSTENKIGFARTHYNRQTANYNERTQTFPSNVVAGLFGFAQRDLFTLSDEAERAVPAVEF